MSDRVLETALCIAAGGHDWVTSSVSGHAYCLRCPAVRRSEAPDPRLAPVDVVDRIDELVNESLGHVR